MKKYLPVLFLAAATLAVPVRGQVNYGGYVSLDYVKGGGEGAPPGGSAENLLAGFLAVGQIGQRFGFTLEARAREVSVFELEQAWIGFLPSQTVTVKAGLYLVPFGLYNRAGRPHETPLIGRPLNLESIYPSSWRDLGLVVEGVIGFLSYSGYLGSGLSGTEGLGSGQQFRDNNTDWAKGGRIGLALGSDVRAGVSYYTGKHDAEGQRDIVLEGVDLAWVTAQWEVHGEYTKGLIENPEPFEKGRSEGTSIWMLMGFRSLQPVGSFQTVKVEDPYLGDAISQDRSRWTLGLRWVLSPNLFIKLEYAWNKEELILPPEEVFITKNRVLQVQAALSF